tara:strand:- start:337 stop:546 length:210 start_codon:yes stop_codon:yes gene_type:complete
MNDKAWLEISFMAWENSTGKSSSTSGGSWLRSGLGSASSLDIPFRGALQTGQRLSDVRFMPASQARQSP